MHRYELVERIAVGGMAEVFKAKAFGSHGFEKVLAIKRILPELARDAEFENRFIAEAKLTVALTHANIVQVFDFGRFGGSLYIAMEHVDGPDLAALISAWTRKGQPIPMSASMYIGMELCKALDFAHRRGVVHRDISPSNILISREGEVKVADFGIAHTLAESQGALSGTRRIMGKWPYMSPEQARGEKLDARSDLFSVGVVLYELFTGTRLFPGSDVQAIIKSLHEMEIPLPSALRPGLPPALDGVLGRALERDPTKRYPQAVALLRALTEISYQSTLVATASDVASVVEEAFAPSASAREEAKAPSSELIDDIIRSELLGAEGGGESEQDVRVTVKAGPPTVFRPSEPEGTGGAVLVRREVGDDGITVWELDAGEKARIPSVQVHAEVKRPLGSRPPVLVASALMGALAVGLVGWIVRRSSSHEARMPDAALAQAYLRIEGNPGASILLNGVEWREKAPTTVPVPPSDAVRPHAIEVRLPGFRPWRDPGVVVRADERLVYRPQLEPMVGTLIVQSEPSGAVVELDGHGLGETPLIGIEVRADDRPHSLRVRKNGYVDVSEEIRVVDGKTIVINRRLEPLVRYGTIDLFAEPWAEVFLEGRKVGEAPARGLKLPMGRHRLRLVNPVQHRETVIVVDVPSKRPYRVSLP